MSDASQDDAAKPDGAPSPAPAQRTLSAAARRALDEAAARHRQRDETERPVERGGRGGLEPVRFGDWEIKGLASDF